MDKYAVLYGGTPNHDDVITRGTNAGAEWYFNKTVTGKLTFT